MATQPDLRQYSGRLVAWLAFVVAFAALQYLSRLEEDATPEDIAYRYEYSLAAAVLYAIMVGILLLIAHGLPLRFVFALRRPAAWGRAIGLGILALLVIFGASAALAPFLDAEEEQGLLPEEWDRSRLPALVAFFILVAVVAPVVEELIYRGLGYSLLAPYGTGIAIVVTAVLFGAAHGLVQALPVLTIFGLAIGWLRAKTNSIYPPMLLHATFNGTALIVSVATAGG